MLNIASTDVPTNFSGRWRVNKLDSVFGLASLRDLEDGTMSISHRSETFQLKRVFVIAGKPHPAGYEVAIDGSEHVMLIGKAVAYAVGMWHGRALVVRMRIPGPQGESHNQVCYTLLNGGQRLEAAEEFTGPAVTYDNLWILDRIAEG